MSHRAENSPDGGMSHHEESSPVGSTSSRDVVNFPDGGMSYQNVENFPGGCKDVGGFERKKLRVLTIASRVAEGGHNLQEGPDEVGVAN